MTDPEARRPRDRPHVVVVSGYAPPAQDGVGDCTAALLRELVRQRPGWRWSWLTRRLRWFHPFVAFRSGVTVYRPNRTWTPRGIDQAAHWLRRLRPDLVQIEDQIHSFHETDAAVRLASATSAPVVTTLHEYHTERESVRHTTELVRRSRIVIANDRRAALRCREQAGREPDHTWWSGTGVLPPEPSWGVRPVPGTVVTFGFLNALKRLEEPFRALGRLREAHPALRWRIIGPFHPANDRHHAELAGHLAADWVEFTGGFRVDDRRLRTLLGQAHVALLPFADGASPRRSTLHAAWACGVPVVTTPPDDPEPALVDGENCLLVADADADGWFDALARLLSDPALVDRLRAGSREAAARFGMDRLAEKHIAVYEDLLR